MNVLCIAFDSMNSKSIRTLSLLFTLLLAGIHGASGQLFTNFVGRVQHSSAASWNSSFLDLNSASSQNIINSTVSEINSILSSNGSSPNIAVTKLTEGNDSRIIVNFTVELTQPRVVDETRSILETGVNMSLILESLISFKGVAPSMFPPSSSSYSPDVTVVTSSYPQSTSQSTLVDGVDSSSVRSTTLLSSSLTEPLVTSFTRTQSTSVQNVHFSVMSQSSKGVILRSSSVVLSESNMESSLPVSPERSVQRLSETTRIILDAFSTPVSPMPMSSVASSHVPTSLQSEPKSVYISSGTFQSGSQDIMAFSQEMVSSQVMLMSSPTSVPSSAHSASTPYLSQMDLSQSTISTSAVDQMDVSSSDPQVFSGVSESLSQPVSLIPTISAATEKIHQSVPFVMSSHPTPASTSETVVASTSAFLLSTDQIVLQQSATQTKSSTMVIASSAIISTDVPSVLSSAQAMSTGVIFPDVSSSSAENMEASSESQSYRPSTTHQSSIIPSLPEMRSSSHEVSSSAVPLETSTDQSSANMISTHDFQPVSHGHSLSASVTQEAHTTLLPHSFSTSSYPALVSSELPISSRETLSVMSVIQSSTPQIDTKPTSSLSSTSQMVVPSPELRSSVEQGSTPSIVPEMSMESIASSSSVFQADSSVPPLSTDSVLVSSLEFQSSMEPISSLPVVTQISQETIALSSSAFPAFSSGSQTLSDHMATSSSQLLMSVEETGMSSSSVPLPLELSQSITSVMSQSTSTVIQLLSSLSEIPTQMASVISESSLPASSTSALETVQSFSSSSVSVPPTDQQFSTVQSRFSEEQIMPSSMLTSPTSTTDLRTVISSPVSERTQISVSSSVMPSKAFSSTVMPMSSEQVATSPGTSVTSSENLIISSSAIGISMVSDLVSSQTTDHSSMPVQPSSSIGYMPSIAPSESRRTSDVASSLVFSTSLPMPALTESLAVTSQQQTVSMIPSASVPIQVDVSSSMSDGISSKSAVVSTALPIQPVPSSDISSESLSSAESSKYVSSTQLPDLSVFEMLTTSASESAFETSRLPILPVQSVSSTPGALSSTRLYSSPSVFSSDVEVIRSTSEIDIFHSATQVRSRSADFLSTFSSIFPSQTSQLTARPTVSSVTGIQIDSASFSVLAGSYTLTNNARSDILITAHSSAPDLSVTKQFQSQPAMYSTKTFRESSQIIITQSSVLGVSSVNPTTTMPASSADMTSNMPGILLSSASSSAALNSFDLPFMTPSISYSASDVSLHGISSTPVSSVSSDSFIDISSLKYSSLSAVNNFSATNQLTLAYTNSMLVNSQIATSVATYSLENARKSVTSEKVNVATSSKLEPFSSEIEFLPSAVISNDLSAKQSIEYSINPSLTSTAKFMSSSATVTSADNIASDTLSVVTSSVFSTMASGEPTKKSLITSRLYDNEIDGTIPFSSVLVATQSLQDGSSYFREPIVTSFIDLPGSSLIRSAFSVSESMVPSPRSESSIMKAPFESYTISPSRTSGLTSSIVPVKESVSTVLSIADKQTVSNGYTIDLSSKSSLQTGINAETSELPGISAFGTSVFTDLASPVGSMEYSSSVNTMISENSESVRYSFPSNPNVMMSQSVYESNSLPSSLEITKASVLSNLPSLSNDMSVRDYSTAHEASSVRSNSMLSTLEPIQTSSTQYSNLESSMIDSSGDLLYTSKMKDRELFSDSLISSYDSSIFMTTSAVKEPVLLTAADLLVASSVASSTSQTDSSTRPSKTITTRVSAMQALTSMSRPLESLIQDTNFTQSILSNSMSSEADMQFLYTSATDKSSATLQGSLDYITQSVEFDSMSGLRSSTSESSLGASSMASLAQVSSLFNDITLDTVPILKSKFAQSLSLSNSMPYSSDSNRQGPSTSLVSSSMNDVIDSLSMSIVTQAASLHSTSDSVRLQTKTLNSYGYTKTLVDSDIVSSDVRIPLESSLKMSSSQISENILQPTMSLFTFENSKDLNVKFSSFLSTLTPVESFSQQSNPTMILPGSYTDNTSLVNNTGSLASSTSDQLLTTPPLALVSSSEVPSVDIVITRSSSITERPLSNRSEQRSKEPTMVISDVTMTISRKLGIESSASSFYSSEGQSFSSEVVQHSFRELSLIQTSGLQTSVVSMLSPIYLPNSQPIDSDVTSLTPNETRILPSSSQVFLYSSSYRSVTQAESLQPGIEGISIKPTNTYHTENSVEYLSLTRQENSDIASMELFSQNTSGTVLSSSNGQFSFSRLSSADWLAISSSSSVSNTTSTLIGIPNTIISRTESMSTAVTVTNEIITDSVTTSFSDQESKEPASRSITVFPTSTFMQELTVSQMLDLSLGTFASYVKLSTQAEPVTSSLQHETSLENFSMTPIVSSAMVLPATALPTPNDGINFVETSKSNVTYIETMPLTSSEFFHFSVSQSNLVQSMTLSTNSMPSSMYHTRRLSSMLGSVSLVQTPSDLPIVSSYVSEPARNDVSKSSSVATSLATPFVSEADTISLARTDDIHISLSTTLLSLTSISQRTGAMSSSMMVSSVMPSFQPTQDQTSSMAMSPDQAMTMMSSMVGTSSMVKQSSPMQTSTEALSAMMSSVDQQTTSIMSTSAQETAVTSMMGQMSSMVTSMEHQSSAMTSSDHQTSSSSSHQLSSVMMSMDYQTSMAPSMGIQPTTMGTSMMTAMAPQSSASPSAEFQTTQSPSMDHQSSSLDQRSSTTSPIMLPSSSESMSPIMSSMSYDMSIMSSMSYDMSMMSSMDLSSSMEQMPTSVMSSAAEMSSTMSSMRPQSSVLSSVNYQSPSIPMSSSMVVSSSSLMPIVSSVDYQSSTEVSMQMSSDLISPSRTLVLESSAASVSSSIPVIPLLSSSGVPPMSRDTYSSMMVSSEADSVSTSIAPSMSSDMYSSMMVSSEAASVSTSIVPPMSSDMYISIMVSSEVASVSTSIVPPMSSDMYISMMVSSEVASASTSIVPPMSSDMYISMMVSSEVASVSTPIVPPMSSEIYSSMMVSSKVASVSSSPVMTSSDVMVPVTSSMQTTSSSMSSMLMPTSVLPSMTVAPESSMTEVVQPPSFTSIVSLPETTQIPGTTMMASLAPSTSSVMAPLSSMLISATSSSIVIEPSATTTIMMSTTPESLTSQITTSTPQESTTTPMVPATSEMSSMTTESSTMSMVFNTTTSVMVTDTTQPPMSNETTTQISMNTTVSTTSTVSTPVVISTTTITQPPVTTVEPTSTEAPTTINMTTDVVITTSVPTSTTATPMNTTSQMSSTTPVPVTTEAPTTEAPTISTTPAEMSTTPIVVPPISSTTQAPSTTTTAATSGSSTVIMETSTVPALTTTAMASSITSTNAVPVTTQVATTATSTAAETTTEMQSTTTMVSTSVVPRTSSTTSQSTTTVESTRPTTTEASTTTVATTSTFTTFSPTTTTTVVVPITTTTTAAPTPSTTTAAPTTPSTTEAPTTSTTTQAPTTTTAAPTTPSTTEAPTTTQAPTTTTAAPTTPSTTEAPTTSTSTQAPTTTTAALTTSTVTQTTTQVTSPSTAAPTSTVAPTTTSSATTSTVATVTTTEVQSTTQAPVPYVIEASIKMTEGVNWTAALLNTTSNEYKVLVDQIRQPILAIYQNGSYGNRFVNVTNFVFRQGSVVATYDVHFSGTGPINNSTLTSDFINNLSQNDMLGGIKVDRQSVTHIEPPATTQPVPTTTPIPTTTAPPESSASTMEVPNWGIAVIACGAIVLLFLIFLICVLCSKRHTKQKYRMPEDPDDIGYVSRTSTHEFAYDNKTMDQEAMMESEEVKNPNFFNLSQSDIQNNANGTQDITSQFDLVDVRGAQTFGMNGVSSPQRRSGPPFRGREEQNDISEMLNSSYDERKKIWQTHL